MKTGSKLAKLGTIGDARGLRGEVWLRMNSKDADFLSQLQSYIFHVQHNGSELLLEPVKLRLLFGKVCAQFKNYDSRTLMEPLKNSEIFVDESAFVSGAGESVFLSEILGFGVQAKLEDQYSSLGRVVGFDSNGAQDLIEISSGETNSLVPFVKAFVEKIDFESKQVYLNLPEGLAEINNANAL